MGTPVRSQTIAAKFLRPDPSFGNQGYEETFNATFLDSLLPVTGLVVTSHEVPSASLNVDVAAGNYVTQAGTVSTYAGVSAQAIAASSTKVLYLDGTNSYALTAAASYPATAHVRLATVVTTATTVSSITDNRQCFAVCGGVADGTTVALGSSSGYQLGTASTQKVGFLGATPAAQQTGGSATAGGSYTATEQSMLQKAYNALRTFGFLS
jgi:hypothetical protein